MGLLPRVVTDKRGFRHKLTPIRSAGMMRFAVSAENILNDMANGRSQYVPPFVRMSMTPATTLTISGGSITATLQQHIVAAQTGTADDLDTIVVADQKMVFLRADAGDTITLRHGVSNINVPSGSNIVLTGNRGVLLVCDNGVWAVVSNAAAKANLNASVDPTSGDDSADGYSAGSVWLNTTYNRVWMCLDATTSNAHWEMIAPWRNSFSVRANDVTAIAVGIAAPTVTAAGTISNANDATTTWLSEATALGLAGICSATFDLVRPSFDPIFECLIKSDSNGTSMRQLIGLTSADVGNADDLSASATKFIGVRYSPGVGDTGFVPLLSSGSAQSVGSALNTIAGSTIYKIKIRIISSLATAYFSLNDGPETAFATNFPAITSDLGFAARVRNNSGIGNRFLYFSRLTVRW